MNTLNIVLNTWTQFEITRLILLTGGISFFLVLTSYYLTKDRRMIYLPAISILYQTVFFGVLIILFREFLQINLTEKHHLAYWIAYFINALNLGVLVGQYYSRMKDKKFDIDHVTREHFKSTFNSTLIVVLAFIAYSAFMTEPLKSTLIIAGLTGSASMLINHLLARSLLKDK